MATLQGLVAFYAEFKVTQLCIYIHISHLHGRCHSLNAHSIRKIGNLKVNPVT